MPVRRVHVREDQPAGERYEPRAAVTRSFSNRNGCSPAEEEFGSASTQRWLTDVSDHQIATDKPTRHDMRQCRDHGPRFGGESALVGGEGTYTVLVRPG
jgi:hypothetical protein